MDDVLGQLLEHGGICMMLLHLLENPNGVVKSIYYKPPYSLASRTVNRNLTLLYQNKLIESVFDPIRTVHKLTEKGIEIAKSLQYIKDTLTEVKK